MYESAGNSRKFLKDDFLRASVVAVAVQQMTAKVLEYWRGRRDLFPRLSRSLPLPSSRKRDLLKCVLERIRPSKYSERLLFHTFTILRVMFGDTSKYTLYRMSEFSEAGVPCTLKLLQGTRPAKAFRFWLYFLNSRAKMEDWQLTYPGLRGFLSPQRDET